MKGLLFGFLASAMVSSGHSAAPMPAPLQAGEWTFNGNAASACVLEADGRATDTSGAQLEVQCDQQAQILGNVIATLPAANLRQRRVTIVAEVRAGDGINASLWLKTARDTATLLFENDAEQTMLSTATTNGWVQRSLTLPVTDEADTVSFGVLLQGGGAVALRNLHIDASGEGPVSPAAQQVLDAALNIIKAQTAARRDIAWRVLETQARIFAAGAQDTADVYPAIKYLLAQLGDKRSLLLTPELAGMLSERNDGEGHHAGSVSAIKVFTLPDGSNLVLSAVLPELDKRVAQNLNR